MHLGRCISSTNNKIVVTEIKKGSTNYGGALFLLYAICVSGCMGKFCVAFLRVRWYTNRKDLSHLELHVEVNWYAGETV